MNDITMKTVLVDGFECRMSDTSATIVQRTIAQLHSKLNDAKKKVKELEEENEEAEEEKETQDAAIAKLNGKVDEANKARDAAIKAKEAEVADILKKADEALKAKDAEVVTLKATKDTEVAALKTQLKDGEMTPTKLDALVRARSNVVMKAKELMGDKFDMSGKTIEDVRKAVVTSKLGPLAEGWSDAQIEASFNTMQASRNGGPQNQPAALEDMSASFGRPGQGYMTAQQAKDKAYQDYTTDIEQAWRHPAGTAQH